MPKLCRTFFWNKDPSLMPGNFIHSFRGMAATITLVAPNSVVIYLPASSLIVWFKVGFVCSITQL